MDGIQQDGQDQRDGRDSTGWTAMTGSAPAHHDTATVMPECSYPASSVGLASHFIWVCFICVGMCSATSRLPFGQSMASNKLETHPFHLGVFHLCYA